MSSMSVGIIETEIGMPSVLPRESGLNVLSWKT
jgi:hypothetical protein